MGMDKIGMKPGNEIHVSVTFLNCDIERRKVGIDGKRPSYCGRNQGISGEPH
jgi:hypothetical protein